MPAPRGLSAEATLPAAKAPSQTGGRRRTVVTALQQGTDRDADLGRGSVVMLAPSDVADNPDNPVERSTADIDDLAASVASVGVLSPLTVTPAAAWLEHHPHHAEAVGAAPWVCLAGHRRLAASRRAEVAMVPAVVRADLAALDSIVLHENLQRVALTPLQEAEAYQRLVAGGMSQREISRHLGTAQGQISKRLSLLSLPLTLKTRLAEGRLEIGDALALLADPGPASLASLADTQSETFGDDAGEGMVDVWTIRRAIARLDEPPTPQDEPAGGEVSTAGEGGEPQPTDPAPSRRPAADRDAPLSGDAAEPPVSDRDEPGRAASAAHERNARWEALMTVAARVPKRDEFRALLTTHTLNVLRPDGPTPNDIRSLAHALAASADLDTRPDITDTASEHMAWLVVLAANEQALRDKGPDSPLTTQDLNHLRLLTERSTWTPSAREQRQIDAATTEPDNGGVE